MTTSLFSRAYLGCWLMVLLPVVLSSQSADMRLRLQQEGANLSLDHPSSPTHLSFQFPAEGLELNGLSIQDKAQNFWQIYGIAWEITSPEKLELLSERRDQYGGSHLIFQQQEREVPILGAELALHFSAAGRLLSGGGFFVLPQVLTELPLPAQAAFTLADLRYQLKDYPADGQWQIASQESFFIVPALFDPLAPKRAYSGYRIHLEDDAGLQELELLYNPRRPQESYLFPMHCDILDRDLYTNNTNSGNLIWSEGDAFPGFLNTNQQDLLVQTEQTYNLFFRSFGRDSYDDEGGTMNIVYDANLITECPNARAGNTVTFYCANTIADDVTAHEWAHVYIRNTSALIYAFESGAVNEAFADIFGEVVDLINGTGNDAGIGNLRTSCLENNTRWKIGEDGVGFGSHIRDMAFPNCRNDPDDRSDSFYDCSTGELSSVHNNSGLVNRAFTLLVDGGIHNGVTINGIGLTKATHIFGHTMLYFHTRATDIHALGDQLRMAANDLVGEDLLDLTTVNMVAGSSGLTITAADLAELDSAIAAVELQLPTSCSISPLLDPNTPDLCASDTGQQIFAEDWENGIGDWTLEQAPVDTNTWEARDWELAPLLPDGRPGQGMYAPSPFSLYCDTNLQNGSIRLISPVISVPNAVTDIKLSFTHYLSIEENYDGGIVFYRRNNGSWRELDDDDFLFNGYNRSLMTQLVSDNPYAGFWAFSGADDYSTSGNWGTSHADLTGLGIRAGDNFQLAWYLATDGCDGWLGWYLDEIVVAYCNVLLPVDLTDFQASPAPASIQLNWRTENEVANLGFWLERSTDGRQFNDLVWMPATAQEGEGAAYSYLDLAVQAGQNYYYRLRQVDQDGSQHYSTIVNARWGRSTDAGLVVAPNPNNGTTFVSWGDETVQKRLELYSLDGRLLQVWDAVSSGQQLTIQHPQAGIYLLRSGAEVRRIVLH